MSIRNRTALVGALTLMAATATPAAAEPTIEVVAEGLEAPRGLEVAADGTVYVAEAGRAGDSCPMGEAGFCFGPTGAIARISDGTVERLAEGLPSAGAGPEIVGPSDVALGDDGAVYTVINWGGDPGERQEGDLGGWLLRIAADGSVEPLTDVAIFETTDDPDAEFSMGVLDTNPHSLALLDGGFVVADAGANALLQIDQGATVSLLSVFAPTTHEFPAELLAAMGPPPESDGQMAPEGEAMAEGEAAGDAEAMAEGEAAPGGMVPVPVESVPTAVVVGPDGAFYVSELTGGPFPVGGARVYRVEPGGEPEVYATGLTNAMDLGFGPDGTLYVAEIVHEGLMGVFAGEAPPIGAILAVPAGGGEAQLVATGEQLMALGGLDVADDGTIYVSANTLTPGGGTVVAVTP